MDNTAAWPSADTFAQANRARFTQARVCVADILAGPGSGKTSAILALIEALRDEYNIAVVVGDAASRVDTRKINEQGIAAMRVNAGSSGHLDGAMLSQAADVLDLESLDLVLLENAGGLDVDADYDLGETAKIVISCVAEGHDTPVEHSCAYRLADAVVLNKVDTMARYAFDREAFVAAVRQENPEAPIFFLSATTGEGVDGLSRWLADLIDMMG